MTLFILVVYLPVLVIGGVLIGELDGHGSALSRGPIEPSAEWMLGYTLDIVKYMGYTEGRRKDL